MIHLYSYITFQFVTFHSFNLTGSIMNNSICINTSALPSDVLELKNDDFYDFVGSQCRLMQSKILQLQLISDAHIFIECDDPTEIMRYDSNKLLELKAKVCLITRDGTSIVLPGVTASFKNLKKRLIKKFDEDAKQLKKNRNSLNTSTSTPLSLPATTVSQRSVHEIKAHLTKFVDQWIDKNRIDLNLVVNTSLTETVDYNIECVDSLTGQQSVAIICGCGSKSTLSRNCSNGYYQVSEKTFSYSHRCALYSIDIDKKKNSFHFDLWHILTRINVQNKTCQK